MKTLLLSVLLLTSFAAKSQDSLWSKVYIDNFAIYGVTAAKAIDDGYAVIAETAGASCLVFRCDSLGNQIWSTRVSANNGSEYIDDILLTHDTCFVISGRRSDAVSGYDDVYVLKLNDSGDTIWSKSFEYNAKNSSTSASKLHICNDSSILLVWANEGETKHFMQSIDGDGTPLWSNIIEHGTNNVVTAIVQDTDDNFYFAEGVSAWDWLTESKVMKTNPSGDVIWANNYANLVFDDMAIMDTQLVVLGKQLGGGISLSYIDTSGSNITNFIYQDVYWDQLSKRGSMIINSDTTITFMNSSPMVAANVVVKTDFEGLVLSSEDAAIEGKKLLSAKNDGLYIVGNGPIYGIKSLTPQVGVMRLDSSWTDGNCNWTSGISNASFFMMGAAPHSCSQTAGIIAVPSQIEHLNYPINEFFGCVDFAGGLEEGDQLVVKVYPNISSGLFSLEMDDHANYRLLVINSIGQIVLDEEFEGANYKVDLSNQENGIYSYQLIHLGTESAASGKIVLMK